MDPITIIVSALAAGAAAGLKPTAEQAIQDAYSSIKAFILRKYGSISLDALEQKPASEARRMSVKEDLTEVGADNDNELLDQAKSLLDVVKEHDPAAAAKLNINLDEVEAAYFKLTNAVAGGDINVGLKNSTFSGGIEVGGLTAGTLPAKK